MSKKIESKELERLVSPFALAVYSKTDPLSIFKHDDGTFSIRGIEDLDELSAEDLDCWLTARGERVILDDLNDALMEKADDYQVDIWNEYVAEWEGDDALYVNYRTEYDSTIEQLKRRGYEVVVDSRQYPQDDFFTVKTIDGVAHIDTFTWPVEKGPIRLDWIATFAYEQDWAFNDPDLQAILDQFKTEETAE